MPSGRHSQRIVIAGASSLLGNEVKSLLEESLFATWDLRLVDEEDVAGTLTEAAGEAAFLHRARREPPSSIFRARLCPTTVRHPGFQRLPPLRAGVSPRVQKHSRFF